MRGSITPTAFQRAETAPGYTQPSTDPAAIKRALEMLDLLRAFVASIRWIRHVAAKIQKRIPDAPSPTSPLARSHELYYRIVDDQIRYFKSRAAESVFFPKAPRNGFPMEEEEVRSDWNHRIIAPS